MPDRDLLIACGREIWAMRQDVLSRFLASGVIVTAKQSKLPAVTGNVAIIPIHGPISQRSSVWQEIFGGASTQGIQAAYSRSINDDRVGAVVFDVDSPGGTVAGVDEAAAMIHEGASLKPTYAIANSDMCSAAYWLASQVGKGHLVAAPGADVGSIGVFAMHEDVSELLAKRGIKVSMLAMPEYKTEFNPYEPIGAEAKEHFMGQLADTYERFASDVARGRGVKADKVKADYGKGRFFHAGPALEKGMVDRIATLPNLVAELTRGNASARVTIGGSKACEAGIIEAFQSGLIECLRHPPTLEIRRRRGLLLTER